MGWFKDNCIDATANYTFGFVKRVFNVSCFTAPEGEEIANLKRSALEVIHKAPKTMAEPGFFEAIKLLKLAIKTHYRTLFRLQHPETLQQLN